MRLGLVLSGGGSKGAFEAGVVAAMEDAGLSPAVLSGTSAGALNAAALAAGLDAAALAGVWTSISDRDVYRLRGDVWRLLRPGGLFGRGNLAERLLRSVGWTWLWEPSPLRRTLVEALGGEQVPDRGVPLVVSAVGVTTGRLVRFASVPPPAHRRSDIYRVGPVTVDHLLASAAIPLLFRPGRVTGDPYWDGGVVANTPVAPALAYEPDTVIVVTTATLERPAPEPRSLAEAVGLLVDTAQRHALEADLAHAETINALCRAAPQATDRRAVKLLLIDPRGLDLGDALHFDPEQARRVLALGRQVGADAIVGWRRDGRLP